MKRWKLWSGALWGMGLMIAVGIANLTRAPLPGGTPHPFDSGLFWMGMLSRALAGAFVGAVFAGLRNWWMRKHIVD